MKKFMKIRMAAEEIMAVMVCVLSWLLMPVEAC